MHPSPRRPETDRNASHQECRGKEYVGAIGLHREYAIEPPPEEEPKERWNDDRPAENADLPEPRTERRFGDLAGALLTFDRLLRDAQQAILLVRIASKMIEDHGAASSLPFMTGMPA
jgi:hypothetical protein